MEVTSVFAEEEALSNQLTELIGAIVNAARTMGAERDCDAADRPCR
jgi:hypothetical protein